MHMSWKRMLAYNRRVMTQLVKCNIRYNSEGIFAEQSPTRIWLHGRETGTGFLLFGGITLSLRDEAQTGVMEDRRGQEGLHS